MKNIHIIFLFTFFNLSWLFCSVCGRTKIFCQNFVLQGFCATSSLGQVCLTFKLYITVLPYFHTICSRGIKASHVMISKNGQVCLSGLHNSLNTIQSGRRLRKVHEFPLHTVDCLHCYSPELLEQVLFCYL